MKTRFTSILTKAATALLVMMLTSVSSWAETVNVGYKDDDGTTKYVDATVLNNTMNDLAEGWYVVNSDVTYSGNLYTNGDGDVNIILCDGATLTANNITPSGDKDRLRIYGQSQGTGTANISGSITGNYSLTINGGTINANILDGYDGSVRINGGTVNVGRISPYGAVSFNGGNVIVTGEVEARNYGNIFLSGGTVKASSYSASDGYVYISKGLTYYDGTGASYTGTKELTPGYLNLTSTEIAAIAGKTLRTFDYRSGTCGDPNVNEGKNVTWLLNLNTKTLTIGGTGAMANFQGGSGVPWKVYKSDITSVLIESGVTTIGWYAFFNCEILATVTFAAGSQLTSIGFQAFYGTALSTITIPASVTTIYDNAFGSCEHLASINVEAGSTSFASDGGVLFNYDKTALVLYPVAKSGTSYEIPSSVESIGDHAFEDCTNLTSITIPDYVTSIGDYAFYHCTGLTLVIIPASVTSIGNGAFSCCENLSKVYVLRYTTPLTTLGANAFDFCNDNLVIVVPASAEYGNATLYGRWSDYTLQDGYTVTCAEGITFTTTNNGPLVEQDETVTLSYTGTATIPAGYCPAYSYNDGSSDHAISGTTFTMPNSNVVVSAVFEAIPWSGTGTSTDPYIIEYPSQLDLLAHRVNGTHGETANNYYQKFFRLGADITYAHTTAWNDASSTENNYTAIGERPISSTEHPFSGTFDGDGHTVSGIRIYKGGSGWGNYFQGLFGFLAGATVKNVTVADARITGDINVGGIAGDANDNMDIKTDINSTIENCHVLSDVTIHAVVSTDSHGGIAGGNRGTVSNCTSAATLTVKDGVTGCTAFGGIVGYQLGGVISNNLAVGVTMPAGTYAGAICGCKQGGTFEYNYYSNCAVGTATSNIGCNSVDISDNDGAVFAPATRYGAITMIEKGTKKHAIIDGNYSGTDGINIAEDFAVDDVTFNRTFPADKYCTIVLPFEINTSYLTGVDYVLSFAGMTYDENGMLTYMAQIVWDKSLDHHVDLQPYTPYMVLTNRSRLSINNTTPVTFVATMDAFTEKDDWEFRGVTAYTIWDATHNNALLGRVYGFAATSGKATDGVTDVNVGDFVRAEAGAYAYPLRAYLLKKETSSAAPRRAVALDDLPDRIPVRIVDNATGSTTEITTTDFTDLTDSDGAWYTLSGTRLNGKPSAKGLYIHNGLKVVIK